MERSKQQAQRESTCHTAVQCASIPAIFHHSLSLCYLVCLSLTHFLLTNSVSCAWTCPCVNETFKHTCVPALCAVWWYVSC